MRILHATQIFLPWLGYQELYLAREQLRAGHEVLVVASNLRSPGGIYQALRSDYGSDDLKPGESVEFGVPTRRLRVRGYALGRPVLAGVGEALRRFRPDVVHAHGYLNPTTFRVAMEKRRRSFRLVVDEHQLPHQSVPGVLHAAQRRVLAALGRRLILPQVDELVAIADGCKDWLVSAYGCPVEQVKTIPLGADIDMFRPDAALRSRVRGELGLDGAPVVLYSGKITAYKRVDLLVEAIARLPVAHRTILVLVGSAEADVLESLNALALARGVRLVVRPSVSPAELAGFFNAADICAWPTDCTVSHLEAAACGRPIVIPGEAGIADRIAANNGFGVQVGNVGDLAGALDRLVSSPSLREEMGRRGRKLIEERYSWRAIAKQFEDLYRGQPSSARDSRYQAARGMA